MGGGVIMRRQLFFLCTIDCVDNKLTPFSASEVSSIKSKSVFCTWNNVSIVAYYPRRAYAPILALYVQYCTRTGTRYYEYSTVPR